MDKSSLDVLKKLSTAITNVDVVLAPLEDLNYAEVCEALTDVEAAKLNVIRSPTEQMSFYVFFLLFIYLFINPSIYQSLYLMLIALYNKFSIFFLLCGVLMCLQIYTGESRVHTCLSLLHVAEHKRDIG